ncbi:dimethyl sulfoxide reductase subunit B, partial [Salmonella enterica subsp. enterica serovar Virginia]|nr:dimethyl sulfoxide reductase subunit B [Salmonella enterica subsp. enterica serovar Virginia]
MTTQYGFFIDSSRCTGCKTCELACKDYKDLTPDVSFRRIYEYAGGDWQEDNGVWHQNVFAYYLSISCNHCEDPACTKVCPSGAMHKRNGGIPAGADSGDPHPNYANGPGVTHGYPRTSAHAGYHGNA